MADLYIDGPMLERVKRNFGHIKQLLDRPAQAMKNVDGSHLGPENLVGRVHSFGDEWGYGIDQLSKFSGSVVESLHSIEKAFDEADTNLAKALTKAADQ